MTMYRKIPAEVEARQWDASQGFDNAVELAAWCNGTFEYDAHLGQFVKTYYWTIILDRLDGYLTARPGEYIIKHPGEGFSTMSAKQFEATYEKRTK